MAVLAGKPETDYTALSNAALLNALGDDAYKWAEAFIQHARRIRDRGDNVLDQAWLTSWFANAIEHSSDTRRWRMEKAAMGDVSVPVQPLK